MDSNGSCRYMSTTILLQYNTKLETKQSHNSSEHSIGNEKTPDPCKSYQYKFLHPLYNYIGVYNTNPNCYWIFNI